MAGDYHLAQFNAGRLKHPLDSAGSAEFFAALDPINALAEATPGFVWRLKDEDGQSASFVEVPQITDPLEIVNYSIWEDLESLKHYVFKSGHAIYLRRRTEWFEPSSEVSTVCWWTPAGTIPPVAEAYDRLADLRTNGPSDSGWPLTKPRAKPAS